MVSSIAPSSVQVGSDSILLTVTGSGFNTGSQVVLGGVSYVPAESSSTTLKLVVPQSALATAQVLDLKVRNITARAESASLPFTVTNPAPILASITPNAIIKTSSGTLTLTGSGFAQGTTTVQIGGTTIQPLSITSDTISIDASSIADASGPLTVSTSNASPGGGQSSQNLYIIDQGIAATQHPLVASASAHLPAGMSFYVEFGEDTTYGRQTSTTTSSDPNATTSILVAGMKPSTPYHMRLHLDAPDGTSFTTADHLFTTGAVSSTRIPVTKITQNANLQPSPGIEMLELVSGNSKQFKIAAFDTAGKIVWYYDYPLTEGIPMGVKVLSNGNIGVVISRNKQVYREIDLAGSVLREISADALNQQLSAAGSPIVVAELHHDFAELPGGKTALLYSEARTLADVPTYQVLGDGIIVVDSDNKILWTWSSFDHIDTNRRPWWLLLKGQLPSPVYDWTHANTLVYSPSDRSLVVSMRHQNWVFKIDFQDGFGSGDILWRLGYQGDFVLQGSTDAADWFYNQHFPSLITDGTSPLQIAILDNGDQRPTDSLGTQCMTTNSCYSRPIVMSLDETAKTATLDWGPHVSYSNFGGEIKKLGDGRIEYTLSTVPGFIGGRMIESTMDPTPTEVWRLDVNQLAYRGERLGSLYPNLTWQK